MAATRQSSPSQGATQKAKKSLVAQILFHPMLYLAVLIHGAVLAIPGGPEDELPPEVEEEQEIEITMLPAIIEPIPEIDVENLPEEEAPAAAAPPPVAAPIQEQQQIAVDKEQDEPETEPMDEGGEPGSETPDEGDDKADDGASANPTESVDAVVNLIYAVVQTINSSRGETTQIEPSQANNPVLYKNKGNYFIEASTGLDGEFKPGVIQRELGENKYVPVALDDINPDDFLREFETVLGALPPNARFTLTNESEKLPVRGASPSRNDILLKVSNAGETEAAFYLALARANGKTVIVVPWTASSFADATE